MKLFNWLLRQSNKSAYNSFDKDIEKFMDYQKEYLMTYVRENKGTVFGQEHGFDGIRSIEDFQQNVMPMDYNAHEPYIKQHMEEGIKALIEEEILLFELSSGSTSASKFIPYTKGLKEDFMAGVKPWLYNLYTHYPSVLEGKAYWSISPIQTGNNRSKTGIPIGFEDDTGYFGRIQSWLFKHIFAVPSDVKFIDDIEDFRYVTLLFLLSERKLSFVSVWNPTFFTLLLDAFIVHYRALIEDLDEGVIHPPNESELSIGINKAFKARPKRANELNAIMRNQNDESDSYKGIFQKIWPYLKVISCWDQGNSRWMANQLSSYFDSIVIQGKGLLATEGLVTFPVEGIGHVVSYKSHFFEFVEIEDNINTKETTVETTAKTTAKTIQESMCNKPRVYLLNELELGKKYSVLMTTRGGLYRYRLYDIVRVTGFHKALPCLEFIGKEANVSDFYGEKLNEQHLKAIIEGMKPESNELDSKFYFLAPCRLEDGFAYVLFIKGVNSERARHYGETFEEGLMENYHYSYARHLGQINPLKVYIMKNDSEKTYCDHISKVRGMKLGDIKFQLLSAVLGFDQVMDGYFLKEDE